MVDPAGPRHRGLTDTAARHRLGQPKAEQGGAVAFVHYLGHLVIFQNKRDLMLRTFGIPGQGSKW